MKSDLHESKKASKDVVYLHKVLYIRSRNEDNHHWCPGTVTNIHEQEGYLIQQLVVSMSNREGHVNGKNIES